MEKPGDIIGKGSLDKTGIFTAPVLEHDEIRDIIAPDLINRDPFPDGKSAYFTVLVARKVEERDHLEPFDDRAIGFAVIEDVCGKPDRHLLHEPIWFPEHDIIYGHTCMAQFITRLPAFSYSESPR